MERRTALKNLTLSFGYVVAAPTIMNLFASCTEKVDIWKPVFLSDKEKHIVMHLVDIIFPKSELPGALEVNIPQFIDTMYKEIETDLKKDQFQKGANIFANKLEEMFDRKVEKCDREEIKKLLSTYFDLPDDKLKKVLKEQKMKVEKVGSKKMEDYLVYKFLTSVRYYTIFGYFTSEKIGKEILNYDPVPGVFHGCVPLADIGNVWSL